MRKLVFDRPKGLLPKQMHYCPGCNHGILHRLVAEAIDDLDILQTAVGVCPVGCSVLAFDYFACDMIEASHGRAPAVATGVKRTRPYLNVFTYQGDGDLASIGMAEIIHSAGRGENISVFFVNNAVYGMTGGQMAPTTLVGQKTTTSPFGRDVSIAGYPMKMCELLSSLEGVAFLARVALSTPKNVLTAKRAVRRAFECQLKGKGFAMVEALSCCPVQWGMSAYDASIHVNENMIPYYPLGTFIDKLKEEEDAEPKKEAEEAQSA